MQQFLDRLPTPVANWLRGRFGKHLSRFAGVAVLSLVTTQVVLYVAYIAIGTGGTATLLGWAAGVLVSYLLSRRAWDRRGRPEWLKETLPFLLISGVTAVVLTTAGHFAGVYAKSAGMPKFQAAAFVGAMVLLANLMTFVLRFLVFHYILFTDGTPRGRGARGSDPAAQASDPESITPAPVTVPPSDRQSDGQAQA